MGKLDAEDLIQIQSLIVKPLDDKIQALSDIVRTIHTPANCPITLTIVPDHDKRIKGLEEVKAGFAGKWSIIAGVPGFIAFIVIILDLVERLLGMK